MGINLRNLDGGEEYRQNIFDLGEILLYRIIRPWLEYDCIFRLTECGKRMSQVLSKAHLFTRKVISEKKIIFDKMRVKNNSSESM